MSDERIDPFPAAWALLSYAAGLCGAAALTNPTAALTGTVAVGALVLCSRRSWRLLCAVLLAFLSLGLARGLADVRAHRVEDALTTRFGETRFVTIRATIEDDWQLRPDGQYRLRVRRFDVADGDRFVRFERRLVITCRDEPPDLLRAREVEAEGFLRRIPGGDYRLAVKSSKLIHAGGEAFAFSAAYWNRVLSRRVSEAAGEWECARRGAALTEALALGRGGGLPDEIIESYQRGGSYHLLVFSGLQVALLAGAVRWLVSFSGLPRVGDIALLAVCFFVPAFVGSDPSVSRSAWMLGLFMASRLWRRPVEPANLLFVSALIRLIVYPDDLAAPGFALTYAATGGILLLGARMARAAGATGFPSTLFYGAGAEIATMSLTLFWFCRIVPGGSLTTLLLGPILLAMLVFGGIACLAAPFAPDIAFVLLDLVGGMNDAATAVNGFIADTLHLSFVGMAPLWWVVVVSVIAAVLVCSRGDRSQWKVPALVLVAPVAIAFAMLQSLARVDGFQMYVLDVGQGDAILLRSETSSVLVDSGGRPWDAGFGRRVLLRLLLDRGARSFDTVVLTHPHPDHCGGMAAVIRELRVGRILVSRRHVSSSCVQEILSAAASRGVPVEDFEAAHPFTAGSATFVPITSAFRFKRSVENNSSVVLRVDAEGRSILLAGDVEREAESLLRHDHAAEIRADVLKVPHHGSRSSSTPAFLAAVGAKIAIISCGRDNLFGHPAPEVLLALAGKGARTWRTDANGTIHLAMADGKINVETEFDTPTAPP